MSIDEIVPLIERVVRDREEEKKDDFFSYRHAQEVHALGVKHEFISGSPWSQVCASVVISSLMTPNIWVRILWSRPKTEFPPEDCTPWEFPLSEAGVRLFEEQWPVIRDRLARAIIRGHPPEEPNK
jgi:hypothetical protein